MGGMADLRIDDATTASAVATLRAAAGRLAPVLSAVQGLDTEVVGVNALADQLGQADQALAAALTALGKALTAFATEVSGAATALATTDLRLAVAGGTLASPAAVASARPVAPVPPAGPASPALR